jgi:four helix bundle protein
MAIRNYRDLIAWQKAMDFVETVCRLTKSFPKEETYALATQLRRAGFSIPSNIAEGQGRRGDREFLRFLDIAHGSLREAETQLMIAQRLKYISEAEANAALEQASEVGRLITGLSNSLDVTK